MRSLRPSDGSGTDAAHRASQSQRACRSGRAVPGRRAMRRCRCRRGSSCTRDPRAAPRAARRAAAPIASSAGCGRSSPRVYQRERRGSSSMRSYMRRRPCLHSTRSIKTSRSVSAPASQPRDTSIHDASSRSMRSNRACSSTRGSPTPARVRCNVDTPTSVANTCSSQFERAQPRAVKVVGCESGAPVRRRWRPRAPHSRSWGRVRGQGNDRVGCWRAAPTGWAARFSRVRVARGCSGRRTCPATG